MSWGVTSSYDEFERVESDEELDSAHFADVVQTVNENVPKRKREERERNTTQGGDGEGDEEDDIENILGVKRVGRREPVRSIQEAFDLVNSSFVTQIELAQTERPKPNIAMRGDSIARRYFYALLPPSIQRTIFLDVIIKGGHYERIHGLVGAPPYAFLKTMDMGSLRAAGISSGRVNITYDNDDHIVNYSQFGEAEMLDDFMRQYRLVREDNNMSAPLGVNGVRDALSKRAVVAFVMRIKRTNRESRRKLETSSAGVKMLHHPLIGEILTLNNSDIFSHLIRERHDAIRVKVRNVVRSGPNSATALIYVTA